MSNLLNRIPGFRSRTVWKMVIAGLYYFTCFTMIAENFFASLVSLAIPFLFFYFKDKNTIKLRSKKEENTTRKFVGKAGKTQDYQRSSNKNYREFKTAIAGVKHKNDDGTDRQKIIRKCKKGEKLLLIKTPVPQHENGIRICRQNGECLGWVPRDIAEELVADMEDGQIVEAYFYSVLKPSKEFNYYGGKITIRKYNKVAKV